MTEMADWQLPSGDDRLSGYLDGELPLDEATALEGALAVHANLADELRRAREARDVVRALPVVEPPAGFLERLLDGEARVVAAVAPARWRPSRRQLLVANALSVAAAIIGLVVVGVGVGQHPASTEVAGALEAHDSTRSQLHTDGGLDPLRPYGGSADGGWDRDPRSTEEIGAPYLAPLTLDGGYELVAAYSGSTGLHLFYSDGRYGLSVFEQVGTLNWDGLPADGERIEVGDKMGWHSTDPRVDGRVVVFADGDLAVLVAGDEAGDAVLAAAASLPPVPDPSLVDRARRLAGSALEQLSPIG